MDLAVSIVVATTVAACPWVGMAAYRAGRRTGGRKTMPWRPIFQLVDHRTHCLGHDPARVQHDLGALLALPPVAWGELLAMRRPMPPIMRQRVATGTP
jgi:hypothetical protein